MLERLKNSAAVTLVRDAFSDWSDDGAPRLAAALAYYTVFSIAPLLFIVVAVAGIFFADASDRVGAQMAAVIGDDAAAFVSESASRSGPGGGIVATVIGVVTLLFGAAGLFGQLQDSLNTIWEVRPKPGQGILGFIRRRFFSFAMVGGTAFLLLASLIASTVISAFLDTLGTMAPGLGFVWQVVNFVIATGVATLIFAIIFKVVPDVVIRWSDVWVGAAFTGVLFTVGQIALGLYLGRQASDSTYGAAGSLIVVLLWVYYAAQILFLGAEFTQVTAKRSGRAIMPARDAEPIGEAAREQQGMAAKPDPAQDADLTAIRQADQPSIALLLGYAAGSLARRVRPFRRRA